MKFLSNSLRSCEASQARLVLLVHKAPPVWAYPGQPGQPAQPGSRGLLVPLAPLVRLALLAQPARKAPRVTSALLALLAQPDPLGRLELPEPSALKALAVSLSA